MGPPDPSGPRPPLPWRTRVRRSPGGRRSAGPRGRLARRLPLLAAVLAALALLVAVLPALHLAVATAASPATARAEAASTGPADSGTAIPNPARTGTASTSQASGGPTDAGPAGPDPTEVRLVLFHGEGCPHCAAERAWLEELSADYPDLRVEQYEVWYDESNRDLLGQYARDLGFEPSGVPVTIVGDRVWIGFSDGVAGQIQRQVAADLAAAGPDAGAGTQADPDATAGTAPAEGAVPLLGSVALAEAPLVLSTVLIGFADGINPCSLWVLAVLLAVVLHAGSRGRVALVGGTFLAVTAAMYGLYIAGMYSALDYVAGLGWIRLAVAAVAVAFGALQLKDGIAPAAGGPTLSISPGRRPRLYAAMRRVADPRRGVAATLAGTVVLAVGVSLLETPCTAGLPLMWTAMLVEQQVATAAAIGLFAVYMAVFLLDELVLFGAAVVGMRARRLQQHEGRTLKIISGSLLVTLGAVMLVAPSLLTQLGASLAVFAAAGLLALSIRAVALRRPG